MIRRPPRSTLDRSSAASDVYKRQVHTRGDLAFPGASRDPKDDKFLACAVEGEAAYLVSGDEDLLSLKHFQGISIVRPADFVRLVESGSF